MALTGIAVGTEVLCRLSLVVPKAVHKAAFTRPRSSARWGPRPVSARRSAQRRQIVDALGIAGSMAGGIIEYLAEGAWTKRLHAGWAAQSACARRCWRGRVCWPAHGVRGRARAVPRFAHTTDGDYGALTGDFGTRW